MHSHTVCQMFSIYKKYNFNQVFIITCFSSLKKKVLPLIPHLYLSILELSRHWQSQYLIN